MPEDPFSRTGSDPLCYTHLGARSRDPGKLTYTSDALLEWPLGHQVFGPIFRWIPCRLQPVLLEDADYSLDRVQRRPVVLGHADNEAVVDAHRFTPDLL